MARGQPPTSALTRSGVTAESLLGASPHGFLALDRERRVVFANGAAEPLLGSPAEVAAGRELSDLVPGAADGPFDAACTRALEEGTPVRLTERFEPSGRWFDLQVVPQGAGLAVFFHDVTALKASEGEASRLAAVHEGIRTVAAAVAVQAEPELVFDLICDQSTRLAEASAAWLVRFVDAGCEVVATTAPAGRGWPLTGHRLALHPGAELAQLRDRGGSVVVEQHPTEHFTRRGLHAAVLVPVHLGGELWGALGVAWTTPRPGAATTEDCLCEFADLAALAVENARARSELTRQATADPLTELANRRTLLTELDRRIAAAGRGRGCVALALVDVDDFSAVNAHAGQEAGDATLRALAGLLREHSRPGDLPARASGDTFAVLLDQCDGATAVQVAERLRAAVAHGTPEGLPAVTVSVGVSTWEPGLDRAALLRRAGRALQAAKGGGRNTTRAYGVELAEALETVKDPEPATAALAADNLWEASWDGLSKHIAVLDHDGRILATNEAWRRFARENGGDPAGTGVGANYLDVCAADAGNPYSDRVGATLRAMLAGEAVELELDYPCRAPGRDRWFTVRAARFGTAEDPKVIVRHQDVTDRRRAEQTAAFRAELLGLVALPVFAVDAEHRVCFWNAACEAALGWSAEEVHGRDIDALGILDPASADLPAVVERLEAEGRVDWEVVSIARDGRRFPSAVTNILLRDDEGRPDGFIGTMIDLSERRRNERDLEAARDYLHLLTESIADGLLVFDAAGVVTFANRAAKGLLGHGQQLLGMPVARALYAEDEPEGSSALLDPGAGDASGEATFLPAGGPPLAVDWTASSLSSIGTAVALPEAEHTEGSRVVVFRDVTQRRAEEERLREAAEDLRWAQRLREALAADRFELHAQPIVSVATGKVVDVELLIRLRDADGSLVPPGDFLPRAERQGLITEIDFWVTDQAVRLAATGQAVHFNLSARSVGDVDLLIAMRRTIERTGADPAKLTVELTETALIEDRDRAAAFAAHLRRIGCHVALDDFGAGYNSFARIKDVPADVIKIDRQFVSDLIDTPSSESVVRAILSFASELDIAVVAEGVEDEATARRLAELGVPFAQGWFYGRPAPVERWAGNLPGTA